MLVPNKSPQKDKRQILLGSCKIEISISTHILLFIINRVLKCRQRIKGNPNQSKNPRVTHNKL